MSERKLYRKRPKFNVTAVQFDLDLETFEYNKWGGKQSCKQGDWLVNNDGDIYTVDKEKFKESYQCVSPGVFEKIAEVWAETAKASGAISTIEGSTDYKDGDYLVFDRQTAGDGYAVSKQKFERMYEELNAEFELSSEQVHYLEERLGNIIVSFKKKAKYNQTNYYLWQSLTIVFAALVAVLSGIVSSKSTWLIATLGGASAVVAGFLSLFKYQENMIRYKSAYLDMESQISQFKVGAGPYYDRKIAFTLLVDNCENILSAERGKWSEKNQLDEQKEKE